MKKKERKLVYGKGVNDADYNVTEHEMFTESKGKRRSRAVWVCPFYKRWKNVLGRCYSAAFHERNPRYRGCDVCEEWLTFSNFKAWMEQQDWEGNELEKDIFSAG